MNSRAPDGRHALVREIFQMCTTECASVIAISAVHLLPFFHILLRAGVRFFWRFFKNSKQIRGKGNRDNQMRAWWQKGSKSSSYGAIDWSGVKSGRISTILLEPCVKNLPYFLNPSISQEKKKPCFSLWDLAHYYYSNFWLLVRLLNRPQT